MKTIYLILISIFIHSIAATSATITAVQDGNWNTNSTWNLSRVPANNDVVVIPLGITVMLKNTPYSKNNLATRPSMRINIYGILDFSDPGTDKLYLDAGSIIQIFQNGKIQTSSNSTEIIAIYNGSSDNTVWSGSPSSVSGPAFAGGITSGFLNGVLPVKLISFDAASNINGTVKLSWITAEETGFSHFEIETFNADKGNWKTLGQLMASASSASRTTYSYSLNTVNGLNQFRLKMVDKDGGFFYSPIKTITETSLNTPAIWYDPNQRSVHLKGVDQKIKNMSVDLFDLNGVNHFHQEHQSPIQIIRLPRLMPGNYIVRICFNSSILVSKQIISY
jgi:hypothetical protein